MTIPLAALRTDSPPGPDPDHQQRNFAFILLTIVGLAGAPETLFWRVPTPGQIQFFARCGDAFDGPPLEPIDPDTVAAFERAHIDAAAAAGRPIAAALLYTGRQRGCRPRRQAYPANHALRPLLDACGPAVYADAGVPPDPVLEPHRLTQWYPMHSHPPGYGHEDAYLRHAHGVLNGGHGSHEGLNPMSWEQARATWLPDG